LRLDTTGFAGEFSSGGADDNGLLSLTRILIPDAESFGDSAEWLQHISGRHHVPPDDFSVEALDEHIRAALTHIA